MQPALAILMVYGMAGEDMHQKPWTTYGHYGWSRDFGKHEKVSKVESLWGEGRRLGIMQFGQILEPFVVVFPLKVG